MPSSKEPSRLALDTVRSSTALICVNRFDAMKQKNSSNASAHVAQCAQELEYKQCVKNQSRIGQHCTSSTTTGMQYSCVHQLCAQECAEHQLMLQATLHMTLTAGISKHSDRV
jgi:hypothetical protein